MAEVFIALSRLMKLGNGTESGRGRGAAHTKCFQQILPLEHIKNCLVDGEWGLVEGVSVALSDPLDDPNAAVPGYKAHMDLKNDSREGYDKTGVISYTFRFQGKWRRLAFIGYSRNAAGVYWDRSVSGTATVVAASKTRRDKTSRDAAPMTRRAKQARVDKVCTRGAPRRVPPRRKEHVDARSMVVPGGDSDPGHEGFVVRIVCHAVAWDTLRELPQDLPPSIQRIPDITRLRTWCREVEDRGLCRDHSERPQLQAVVYLGGLFPEKPTAARLALLMRAFLLAWVLCAKTTGGPVQQGNPFARGTSRVWDVCGALRQLTPERVRDIFSSIQTAFEWARECADRDRADDRGVSADVYASFNALKEMSCGRSASYHKKGPKQGQQKTAPISLDKLSTTYDAQIAASCKQLVEDASGEVNGRVSTAAAVAGFGGTRYSIPWMQELGKLPLTALAVLLGLVHADPSFLPASFTRKCGGACLYAVATGMQWPPVRGGVDTTNSFKRALCDVQRRCAELHGRNYTLMTLENVACKVGCRIGRSVWDTRETLIYLATHEKRKQQPTDQEKAA